MGIFYDRALCPQECMQLDTVWTAKIAAHPTLDIPCTLVIDDGDNIMDNIMRSIDDGDNIMERTSPLGERFPHLTRGIRVSASSFCRLHSDLYRASYAHRGDVPWC